MHGLEVGESIACGGVECMRGHQRGRTSIDPDAPPSILSSEAVGPHVDVTSVSGYILLNPSARARVRPARRQINRAARAPQKTT